MPSPEKEFFTQKKEEDKSPKKSLEEINNKMKEARALALAEEIARIHEGKK